MLQRKGRRRWVLPPEYEDEVATDLVGELETENFEGGKQRTSSSLNLSNDDVPKYYRDPYNFMIELPPYA